MPPQKWWRLAVASILHGEGQSVGIAFAPAICLGVFWLAGEAAVALLAVLMPVGLFILHPPERWKSAWTEGTRDQAAMNAKLDGILRDCASGARNAICFGIGIDDAEQIRERHGARAFENICQQLGERLNGAMRTGDSVARLSTDQFAACINAGPAIDLETGLQIASRLQEQMDDPISIEGLTIYPSVSIGFCLASRISGTDGVGWLRATLSALDDARTVGPGGIRAYSTALLDRDSIHERLRKDALDALGLGQIHAWFQPQISTETGDISGVEALARWDHPTRGTLGPDVFLPVLESAGLMDRLADTIIDDALRALTQWRTAGCNIPEVSVNLSAEQLRSPSLRDRVTWALDRHDLKASDLRIEILETVVSEHCDDVICRSILALKDVGCALDLDDYGVGHASIAAIRRFGVSRIKIDRSFVMHIDSDPEQRRMLSAILSMAEQLGLETVGEGVETSGEHALLCQLGCSAVQGYGISRPMRSHDLPVWAREHSARLPEEMNLGRRSGL